MEIAHRRAYGPEAISNKETSIRRKVVDCLTPITSAVRPQSQKLLAPSRLTRPQKQAVGSEDH